jgi:hypothetical protein
MKHLKRFNEEFDRDGYDSHWNKFEQWLSEKDFELYDGREDFYEAEEMINKSITEYLSEKLWNDEELSDWMKKREFGE